MRLHVSVIGSEKFFRAINRRLLYYISPLAPAVVTLLRIAFRILVREDRTHSFQHGLAHEILRRDKLKAVGLTTNFVINRLRNQRINFRQRCIHLLVHPLILFIIYISGIDNRFSRQAASSPRKCLHVFRPYARRTYLFPTGLVAESPPQPSLPKDRK